MHNVGKNDSEWYNRSMDEQFNQNARDALAANDGVVQGDGFILMAKEVYLSEIGNLGADEMQQSLRKIDEATGAFQAGRTRPLTDAINELGTDVQG